MKNKFQKTGMIVVAALISLLAALPAAAEPLPRHQSSRFASLALNWTVAAQNGNYIQLNFTKSASVRGSEFPQSNFEVYYTFPGMTDYVRINPNTSPSLTLYPSSDTNFRFSSSRFITGTDYEFRVVARSVSGAETLVSPPIVVRTPAGAPLNPANGSTLPANPSQYPQFPGSFGTPISYEREITLPIPSDRLPLSAYPASGYRVYQCELEGTRCIELGQNTTPSAAFGWSPGNSLFRAYVRGLTPGMDYDFVVGARRADGAHTVFTRRIEAGTAGPDHLLPDDGASEEPDPVCGNNIVEEGEACDSTAARSCTVNGYPGSQQCRSDCRGLTDCTATARCGDGTRNGNETCDDGAQNGTPNHCNSTCSGITAPACGNQVMEEGEACESGQTQACAAAGGYAGSQACNATCGGYEPCATTQRCGDGAVNGPETCDDGAQNGMPNRCNASCDGTTAPVCGNGVAEAGETCESGQTRACIATGGYDGIQNCNASCAGFDACATTQRCGDGVRNGDETCDEGALNGTPNRCNATCSGVTAPVCGNGTMETGESCESGQTQACTATGGYAGTRACNTACSGYGACSSARSCGDNSVNGNEACDDGNTAGGDGCSSACTVEQSNEDPDFEPPASKASYWRSRTVSSPADLDLTVNETLGADHPVRSFPQSGNPANAESAMGINITAPYDWGTQWMYLDLFKSSRSWVSQMAGNPAWDASSTDPLDLDADGWVRSLRSGQRAATVMIDDTSRYPVGRYVVRYDGEGTFTFSNGSRLIPEASRAGRLVIEMFNARQGILLNLTQTNPNNYARNIRVYRESDEALVEAGQVFNPSFLNDIKHFKTLRFMQAQGINDYWNFGDRVATLTPQNRPRVTDAQWNSSGFGIPFEVGVELSNLMNADPWMNIHYGATDDYIREVAESSRELMRDTDNVIYVELGNEAWNFAYPYNIGQNYLRQQADRRWSATGTHPYPGYANTSAIARTLNYYGLRSTEMCAIWKEAWGADADRVRCVMAGQVGYTFLNNSFMYCPMRVAENPSAYRACGLEMDVFATAPYFSYIPSAQTMQSIMSDPDGGLERFLDLLDAQLDRQDEAGAVPGMFRDAAMARQFGLELAAYEGGQHQVWYSATSDNDPVVQFFHRVNRHPRMYDIYTRYMDFWREAGGHTFCHFENVTRSTRQGSFGLKEYQGQPESPKFDAVVDFVYDNPCWWDGCAAP